MSRVTPCVRIMLQTCVLAAMLAASCATAYGAGAQLHFGRLAVRAEYERFEIGSNTSLLSLGATWAFF